MSGRPQSAKIILRDQPQTRVRQAARGRAIERSDAPGFAAVMLEAPAEKAALDGAVLEILVGAMVARVPLTADGATLARIVRALKGAT